ncbi:MAG: hypothetical protein HUK23_04010, partial [Sphaerochaetaceae bacterium]|nr:hypothetical protein [Sphaerochaetaceae bacterium]
MYKVIDSHCHVYPASVAAKAVKGVSVFYDGVNSYGDGLLDSVLTGWKAKGID